VTSKKEIILRHFSDWKHVANYTEVDIERIMNDPGMIANENKIRACVNNAKAIKNSLIIDDDDFARETSAMAPVKTVQDSNVKVSEKATSSNQRSKIISVNSGLSIPQVIDNIIVKSQYVVGEILKKNNQKIQTENNPETVTKLTWFTISPTVEILGRDQTTNDWTYKITYQILPYEVPYLRSQYVGARSKYYGPIKEYQYLLT
jgi:predicted ribosome quality control (RQC) complex YloA/Tae2 family protein